MLKRSGLLLLCGCVLAAPSHAQGVAQSTLGEAVERHLPADEAPARWAHDAKLLEAPAGDKLEVRQVTTEKLDTVKLLDVVAPIRFESGVADIPQSHVDALRKVLEGLRGRRNVRLHLVGHADDQPLSGALALRYGDNAGLSRERAGEVAEFLQARLGLPPEAISYEWAGDTRPIASNATAEGRALNRRVEVEVWYDEVKQQLTEQEVLVEDSSRRIEVCRMETVCKLRFKEGHARRARVKNLVPPLRFEDENTQIPPAFIEHVRQAWTNLQDKQNVTVKFIGHTDNAQLTGRNERIYGNALALSKARAHRVALAVQEALGLPSAAVASDGRGASLPLASNDTAQGRALNRRIEVEFWHDDPLRELPDEPQLCPDAGGAEVVTKVYDPPWGPIPPLQLQGGQAVIPPGYTDQLRRALAEVGDKTHARLRFVGYTKNERLDRRTAVVYGDDIGLSAARARRAMETIAAQMQLSAQQAEHEGRGYVSSQDVVNVGFTQGESSHVVVQVVYDEPAVLDDYEGVDVTRLTRKLEPKNPFGLNLMRITVDGQPIDDPGRSSADVQRCTDVALERANIQFRFDNLQSSPRLSVSAVPTTILMRPVAPSELQPLVARSGELQGAEAAQLVDLDPAAQAQQLSVQPPSAQHSLEAQQTSPPAEQSPAQQPAVAEGLPAAEPSAAAPATVSAAQQPPALLGSPVRFRMYANYSAFIARAEVRIFEAGQSTQAAPLSVVPVDASGLAEWQPQAERIVAPAWELQYVLRAYDRSGNFDQTSPQPLWLVLADSHQAQPEPATAQPESELLATYGESALSLRNIPLGSGTVKVQGSGIPPQHTVWVAGRPVPVDRQGNFVAEEILPAGLHTVEVAVLDEAGNGALFLRDLNFKRDDWFYVGLADLTVSQDSSSGPAELLQGERAADPYDSGVEGRLAFYLNGKFNEHWRLTASADTREGPVEELFSNFLDKSPDSLFRRIDPDYHYPTFADDAIVEEMAPTLGKFYVKLSHNESHALWGNFKIGYFDNELAHVDRGLYGANAHYQSEATTGFGEQRLSLDGFAAEPGTLASREEFRGTGGSLYFLRNQDLLVGSERLRIELRDKDSGLVTGVVNLTPVLDYDIDYLQGRVVLAEPLASTVDDQLLIRSGGLSGDEAYLVVRYEYTPGFADLDALASGGAGHFWLNDYVKIGLTTSSSEQGDEDSSLNGADLTLRLSADSWLKVQAARSEGLVANALYSADGGFGFTSEDPGSFDSASADAYRADLSLSFQDFFGSVPGRLSLYTQAQDEGYSAPGLGTLTDTDHYGGTLRMQLPDRFELRAKADRKWQEQGLRSDAQELNLGYQLTERFSVSTGVKMDSREYQAPLLPIFQEQGERTDGVVQVAFDSRNDWRAYGFVQDTLSKTQQRADNGRIGLGAAYRFTDRLRIDAEASDGDLGPGGRLGSNFLYSERTSLYLNYAVENERTDNGLRGRRGNLISGMKRRLSDASSVYLEERYQDTDSLSGLTHATGMTLAPNERWNFGVNTDLGTLEDARSGARVDREAGGVRIGYGLKSVQVSSAIEYRLDETQQPDQSTSRRKTWLLRNNFKYQLTPDWRLIGKFNHAVSESSLGQFYDGGYTEAVLGYGYRPVAHERLNALAKYTYFYNVPTTEQITPQSSAAQFIQKSHIAALDLNYQLTHRWSVGGKYAYRLGQLSLDREHHQFFDNHAQLFILRTDVKFAGEWEGLVEGRLLDLSDLDEQRSGALLAVYRHLGEHVKVGAGYNFTDFSEDLTDLSFKHSGVFINLIGAL